MTQMGDGRDTPDEFAHLFRPDLEPAPESGDDFPAADQLQSQQPDPFSDWEPLVAVPQAPSESTPQGGMRFDDPPLPPEASGDDELVVEGKEVDAVAIEVDDAPVTPPTNDAPITPPTNPKAGRLFRSRGAPERDDVITAVGSMQARRLRTMARGDEPPAPAESKPLEADAIVVEEGIVEAAPVFPPASNFPTASSGEPAPALQVMAGAARAQTEASPEQSSRSRRDERRKERQEQRSASRGSLTGLGVYAVTIGVTVILAFGETLIFGGEPGVITGIGLLIVSIFAAFAVRTYDGIHAIFAPPIAFLVASLTAGQLGINATGITSRAVVVFFLLGENWIWIVGSTAAALVIVALRRRVG